MGVKEEVTIEGKEEVTIEGKMEVKVRNGKNSLLMAYSL